MKQKILLLLAVLFGTLAFVLTYHQLRRMRDDIRGETQVYKLVALRERKLAGEPIRDEDLVEREVMRSPGDVSSDEIQWRDKASLIGQKLANTVLPHPRALLYTDLQPLPRDRGFSAQPRSGSRAYSIAVDQVSSINYLIQPGDMVDVIVCMTLPDYRGDSSIDMVTLTLLQNVRVLATGARWQANYSYSALLESNRSYATVTLELLPQEVEIVNFAAQRGRLSLSLRNFKDYLVNPSPQSVNFRSLIDELPFLVKLRSETR